MGNEGGPPRILPRLISQATCLLRSILSPQLCRHSWQKVLSDLALASKYLTTLHTKSRFLGKSFLTRMKKRSLEKAFASNQLCHSILNSLADQPFSSQSDSLLYRCLQQEGNFEWTRGKVTARHRASWRKKVNRAQGLVPGQDIKLQHLSSTIHPAISKHAEGMTWTAFFKHQVIQIWIQSV